MYHDCYDNQCYSVCQEGVHIMFNNAGNLFDATILSSTNFQHASVTLAC